MSSIWSMISRSSVADDGGNKDFPHVEQKKPCRPPLKKRKIGVHKISGRIELERASVAL